MSELERGVQKGNAMFRKILCPIDFSPGSQRALRAAVKLAGDGETELVIAHAWHQPALAYTGELPFPATMVDELVAGEEGALRTAVADAKDLGARRVTSRFLTGTPWQRICDEVEEDPAFDLIVMGTEGRTGMRRILIGSVAEKVVRHAACSVLAVRGKNGTSKFQHVLCPIDFSAASHVTIDQAVQLAERGGLGVTLMHVLDVPPRFASAPAFAEPLETADRAAAQHLEQWATELRARVSIPVTTRTRTGSPAAQILSLLEAEPTFDLVVVGSHGRTGIARAILGSVAERIVRHAACPVLVARAR